MRKISSTLLLLIEFRDINKYNTFCVNRHFFIDFVHRFLLIGLFGLFIGLLFIVKSAMFHFMTQDDPCS